MAHVNTMEAAKVMEDMDTTSTNPVIAVKEDVAHKTTGIDAEAVVVKPTVILHITIRHTQYVPIRVKTAGPHQMDIKITWYVVTRCRAVEETATDRSDQYLLVKLM